MKGPFGMLLVGGGIILLVGLFTGKITFPGAPGGPTQQNAQNTQIAGTKAALPGKQLFPTKPDLSCAPGQHQVIVSGGKVMCQAN